MYQGKTPLKSIVWILTLTSAAILATGCESEDDEKVYQGQACLNSISSTNTDVRPCLDAVQGLQSAGASQIRCAAYYLNQGFYDPQRFADALQAISNSGGNPLLAMTGALAFTNITQAQALGFTDHRDLADAAFTECKNSGSPGYAMFAVATRMGSKFAGAVPTIEPDGSATLNPSDVVNMTDVELGDTAAVIFDTYCTGAQTDSPVCSEFNQAVSDPTATPDQVGCQIRQYLDPSATCN